MSEQQKEQQWRGSLRPVRGLLLICAIGLAYFWLSGSLSAPEMLIAGSVLAVFALLLPARKARFENSVHEEQVPADLANSAFIRIVDAMSDPCFLLDDRGVLIHKNISANDAFQHVHQGDSLTRTFRHPQFVATLNEVITTGKSAQMTFTERFPSERWYRARINPIQIADEERHAEAVKSGASASQHIFVLLSEITAQKRSEQMHADFVANASHELRTPLTALIGYLDTLAGPAKNDAEASKKFLSIMRGQADRMSHLIDDLLSLSRIELKEHVRPGGRVNMETIIDEVRDSLHPIAKKSGNNIVITCDLDDAVVTGERTELIQVFENLLDNALKYGKPDSPVTLEIGTATSPAQRVAVRVTNQGNPISSEHLPRLTERFYRVDAEYSRAKKGTGLGLAIVKHIVTHHRGHLSIISDSERGTTVTVELP